ncbi:Bug family tripartite tricarboxylate transporter substrate binding protein [Pigmentiphaga litoralis]|uniref:Tripartite-type tricarboxylate transporter receptor subunit TctC n=1 Tax=Pigmentiphaga litoralis TaxID=516702 RepID=A0A7Y9IYA9_9BURK|nr:tripartite tricarboxylate transporter substrate binding protein [Pigmentiphaga litoralis]NYE21976.1 tripartite-type tricarboxylate transporter receptor subunit TctC [Pigmentiphaga litoralis]NYE84409.1 tripartite-type tricarboxylate transporter receptor subunit TctC [Pigmentiphaga litoralis]
MRIPLRGLAAAALFPAALLPALLALPAHAQTAQSAQTPAPASAWPAKPVRVIVPFTAGGLTDVLMRGIGQELGQQWGQAVIVENRPGANTIIGAEAAAKAAPDGYTLLMANDPTLSANQQLYKKLPYDPVNDFVPVINLVATEGLLVVREDFPGKSAQDLIEQAKARPGQVTYGTFGLGSKAHLDAEALARATGVKFNHIPYKGVTEVMAALSGGQIDFTIAGPPSAIPLVKGGKIRALAVAATQRHPLFPDVPTFAESGIAGMTSSSWFGLVAPRGTPAPIVSKVAADISRIIRRPEFQQRYITGVGLTVLDMDPTAYATFLDGDRRRYADQIKAAGVSLD